MLGKSEVNVFRISQMLGHRREWRLSSFRDTRISMRARHLQKGGWRVWEGGEEGGGEGGEGGGGGE